MLGEFPKGHTLTPRATPLHVTQLVAQYLRTVMEAQPAEYPFKWDSDNTKTGIVFDTVYNKESKVYGNRPIVVYNTGIMSCGSIVLDDMADHFIPTQNSMKSNYVTSSTNLKILSRQFAEVEILKNELFSCLVAIRTFLPAITNIHMITDMTASEVQKFKMDETMYMCELRIGYTMQYVWKHLLSQEVLNGVILRINQSQVI
jgi:hypothetical protein